LGEAKARTNTRLNKPITIQREIIPYFGVKKKNTTTQENTNNKNKTTNKKT